MPVAQLLYRAFSAKSLSEAHGLLCAAGELALRLSALARASVWLTEGVTPGPTHDALQHVAHASTGHWVRILRHSDQELSERPRVALLPLSGMLGNIATEREWPAVAALAGAARERGIVTKERLKSVRLHGALGFFEFLNDYRNKTAHGALRRYEFYEHLVPLWFEALGEVLVCADLWGGAWLGVRLDRGGDEWLRLSGKTGLRAQLPNRERAERLVEPGHVAFIAPGAAVPLHPFVSYRVSNLESEQVGVIHRVEATQSVATVGRDVAIERLGSLTYVELASGSVFGDTAARAGMARVLTEILGRDVKIDELNVDAPQQAFPPPGDAEGFVLGGFRIDKKLGGGLTEVVYVATQLSTRARVAVKVLRSGSTPDATAEERFQRGLVALAKCDHKHVVRVLTADLTGDPQHYAMEYVHGADLSRVSRVWRALRRNKPLVESDITEGVRAAMDSTGGESPDPPDAHPATTEFYRSVARLFADAVFGIAHLHEQKVVHRDIKPANFVLTEDGRRLVLIDFGIARRVEESRALTSVDSDPVGTLRYMAPESLVGGVTALDPRVDIYSLGVTLWEVLTGGRLFEARSLPELRAAHRSSARRDPRTAAKEMEAPLALIIEKALEPDRNSRYQSAVELGEDLAAYAQGLPLPHSQARAAVARWLASVRRRPAVLAGAAGVAAIATGAGAYAWGEYVPQIESCGQITERWGAPVCVAGEASDGVTYELTTTGGKVRTMRRVDTVGAPVPEGPGIAQGVVEWAYEYVGDRVRLARGRGSDEQLVIARKYDWDGASTFAKYLFKRGDLTVTEPGTTIAGRILTVNGSGHVTEERFANRDSRPASRDGVLAISYKRDTDGRILEINEVSSAEGSEATGPN